MDKQEYDALKDAVADYARGGEPRPKGLFETDDASFIEAVQKYQATPEGQEMARRKRGREVRRHLRFEIRGLPNLVRSNPDSPHHNTYWTPETLAYWAIEGGLTGRKVESRIERFKAAAARMERLADRMEARQQEETTIRRLK